MVFLTHISFIIIVTLTIVKCVTCDNTMLKVANSSLEDLLWEVDSIQQQKCHMVTKLNKILQQYHEYIVHQFYQKRQYWTTSNLGYRLFKNNISKRQFKRKNKEFTIYLWVAHQGWFYTRHVSNHDNKNPLLGCSVNNCKITREYKKMYEADAIVVHVQPGILPIPWIRRPFQRWVFLSDESPKNVFLNAPKKINFSDWSNVFNWTMNYRTDSDVPVPYGRTLPLSTFLSAAELPELLTDLIPHWKKKQRDVLLTVLMSSCYVHKRMEYIRELQRHTTVHIYGKCSKHNKTSCPGRYKSDCPILNKYIFYLAFENSGCRQYITEKTFYNSFTKGAIPIILGPPKEDCIKLLPPYSFIHTDDFASPKALIKYIQSIKNDDKKLLMYHQWRRFFKIVNEHGYLGTRSSAFCRLCEALNYNENYQKVYSEDDLRLFFDFTLLCKY